jgi:hypothetical protein
MLRKLLVILGFALGTSYASAAIVTVNFEDIRGGIVYENVTSSGFNISPLCHIDVFPEGGSQVIGWDNSGCLGRGLNPEYLGTRPNSSYAYVYVDYGGRPFSFLSYDHYGQSFSILSSKGGIENRMCSFRETDCSVFNTYTLDGPDWNGVKWILFGYSDPGAPAVLIDNLVFRVPLPDTGLLVLTGGLLLWISRRRARSQYRAIL